MADCIVRVISDCFRTGYCYAQQGCAQRGTAPLIGGAEQKGHLSTLYKNSTGS